MKKRILSLLLVVLLVLTLSACTGTSMNLAAYEGMEPEAAAQAAQEEYAPGDSKFEISNIIRVPFGYLLDWLYQFSNNYGLALILFSLIVKLVMLPMSAKSKKSMLKMSRISPLVKALEAKYGDDKQRYNQEVMALYKEEGVSTTGGCLWSFIPLLIVFPLYNVIREPLTYMMHNSRSVSAAIVAYIQASGLVDFGKNTYYAELIAASRLGEFIEPLKELSITAGAKLNELDFHFLGINLAAIPDYKFWTWESARWSQIGLLLIPILSAGSQLVSMLISQKMNGAVATDSDGQKDADAQKTANQTNKTMMLMMPLMSVWIGFSMPASISVYWIAQGIFGTIIDYFLTVRYRKIYDKEDEIRREKAALRAAEEAEKERQRALRREQNPDGIMDNVSKKKLKQQEKEAAAAAAREYESRKTPVTEQEQKAEPLSGDASRPYSRGRAYQSDRYSRKSADAENKE